MQVNEVLRNAWLKRLARDFDFFKRIYLRAALKAPGFALMNDQRKLGKWDRSSRIIHISEWHIQSHSWESVRSTLRHEMAHMYAHEVLNATDETSHGDAFKKSCGSLRCDCSASARRETLESLESSTNEEDRIVAKIQKLLALGSSANEHEAALAMKMASRLLLKYNIDLAQAEKDKKYESRALGQPGRMGEYQLSLANILREHYFVRTIFIHSYDALKDKEGTILEISGSPVNVEIAEYVYGYLVQVMNSLWKESGIQNTRGNGAKLQFFTGLVNGFRSKLREQKDSMEKSEALVWVGDAALEDYWSHRHPHTRKVSARGVQRSSEYAKGVQHGRNISINPGIRGNGGTKYLT